MVVLLSISPGSPLARAVLRSKSPCVRGTGTFPYRPTVTAIKPRSLAAAAYGCGARNRAGHASATSYGAGACRPLGLARHRRSTARWPIRVVGMIALVPRHRQCTLTARRGREDSRDVKGILRGELQASPSGAEQRHLHDVRPDGLVRRLRKTASATVTGPGRTHPCRDQVLTRQPEQQRRRVVAVDAPARARPPPRILHDQILAT